MTAKVGRHKLSRAALALAAAAGLCLCALLGLYLNHPEFQISQQTPAREIMIDEATGEFVTARPEQAEMASCVWPEDEECAPSDRIINQLLLDPVIQDDKTLKIAMANERGLPLGREVFERAQCRVNRCELTDKLNEADAIVWPNADVPQELSSQITTRPRASQVWIAYLLESPPNTFDRRFKRRHRGDREFNWTASYRSDSDIVTPYSKFARYAGQTGATVPINRQDRGEVEANYLLASDRHKQLVRDKRGARVAWLVSNCHAHNGRLEYARELSRHIQVDIFGKCGRLSCAKSNHSECLAHLNANYKFYLAFENSNSREYITEKLYRNALGHNDPDYLLLPIVMGPGRADYQRLAPPESFLHVDDFASPRELASFLNKLNDDPALYYSYFHWKTLGRFVDTKFLCRTCAMLHDSRRRASSKSYADIQEWWWHGEEG